LYSILKTTAIVATFFLELLELLEAQQHTLRLGAHEPIAYVLRRGSNAFIKRPEVEQVARENEAADVQ
jgi:hypothetical protein